MVPFSVINTDTDFYSKTYRVYIKAGTFSRSPSRLEILEGIKGAVLEGAGKVSEGLIEACKSKAIDLAIV